METMSREETRHWLEKNRRELAYTSAIQDLIRILDVDGLWAVLQCAVQEIQRQVRTETIN